MKKQAYHLSREINDTMIHRLKKTTSMTVSSLQW